MHQSGCAASKMMHFCCVGTTCGFRGFVIEMKKIVVVNRKVEKVGLKVIYADVVL